MADNALNVSADAKGTVGVFTTAQSFVTFPVAASLVTIVWKVLARVQPGWAQGEIVALVIALIIGMVIYSMSVVKGETLKEKAIGFVIALFNSFTLAATALGIDTAMK
jgi:hypothetical protein